MSKLKKHFIKDESEGITAYEQALKKVKGVEKKVYKKILPDEKKHLQELKQI